MLGKKRVEMGGGTTQKKRKKQRWLFVVGGFVGGPRKSEQDRKLHKSHSTPRGKKKEGSVGWGSAKS